MLTALLLDLDGTLTNTDPIHLKVWQNLLAPHGYQVDSSFFQQHISGRLNADILADLLPQLSPAQVAEFSTHKEHRFRQLAAEQLAPTPGLMPLLDWAENQGWATAVVTNAPRKNAEFMLATLHLTHRLDTLVIAEELSQAKPHPMPYLEALRRLNVAPEQAIAFEDSVTGVQSAVAAGIYTLGVATTHLVTTLKEAGANQVIADFLDDGLEQFGLLAKSA